MELFEITPTTTNALWPLDRVIDPEFHQKYPDMLVKQLENGLRIVLYHDVNDRGTYMRMMVNGGAIHQKPELRGIAHFMEHMVFQATDRFSDWGEFFKFTDNHNLMWNGATSDTYQHYFMMSDNDNDSLEAAAIALSEIVFHPKFPADKIEKEKQVVLSERKGRMSELDYISYETFNNYYYSPEHSLAGGAILGLETDIMRFDRENAHGFYQDYFHPSNMILMINGGAQIDEYLKLVEKHFATVPTDNKIWNANPAKQFERKLPTVFEITRPEDFEHVNLQMFRFSPASDGLQMFTPERAALNMAEFAITRRLTLDIRDKQGLAYAVGANFERFDYDFTFGFYGEFAPEHYPKAKSALQKYMEELHKFKITEEEVQQAKRSLTSLRWLRGGRELAVQVQNRLFETGQLISPEANVALYPDITAEFINRTLHKYFGDKPTEIVEVGALGQ